MAGGDYIVRANRLNFRSEPGLDSNVISQLAKGTVVSLIAGGDSDIWWEVQPKSGGVTGFVARRYLSAISSPDRSVSAGANEVLWEATQAAIAAGVRYKLGDKHSSAGSIDCSGWVAEITIKAFQNANAAAVPEIVFDQYDNGVLRNHSDAIVTGIEARTGSVLHGPAVTAASLHNGMLIGCNFGDYTWERTIPPRKYGIDHIVQVVSNPADDSRFITQSSHSGNGVNLQPLDSWLASCASKGMMSGNRVHAVDPFLLADPHTHFAEALTVAPVVTAPAPVPAWVESGSHAAFSGRGMWVYTLADVLRTFSSIDNAVREMQRCHLNHIWVRIHGRGYIGDSRDVNIERMKSFISAAREAGIAVAGWGWCQGADPVAEAALAYRALTTFGVDDYVADIEQGVNDAKWTGSEVLQFITEIREHLAPAAGLAVSSHGFIEYQEPKIFTQAAKHVDCFNPQAYWYTDKPNAKMLKFAKVTATDYPMHNSASYAKLCYDRWTKLYSRPIVLSGQVCPEMDLDQAEAQDKLDEFLRDFDPPDGLVGLNFWHWGSTTSHMRDSLANSH